MKIVEKSMEIIANAGEGKSLAMTALKEARINNNQKAETLIQEAREAIVKSHNAHSELLFFEAEEGDLQLSLLLVHAADHLTAANTVVDLASEMIYMYKEMREDND